MSIHFPFPKGRAIDLQGPGTLLPTMGSGLGGVTSSTGRVSTSDHHNISDEITLVCVLALLV